MREITAELLAVLIRQVDKENTMKPKALGEALYFMIEQAIAAARGESTSQQTTTEEKE